MRRVPVLILNLSVALAVAMPARGQAQEAECKAIIEKALKAEGGADKVKAQSLKAIIAKAKGNIEVMEMKLDFTLEAYSQPPVKSKAIIKLNIGGMDVEIMQGFDGKKGWISFAGKAMDMEQPEIDEHLAMIHVEEVTNLYPLTEDKGFKLAPLGESKVGDTPVVGVQVTKKDKRDVNLYFDKKTHLLVKADYRAVEGISKMEVAQEKIFSEYKEIVPGVKVAMKQVVNNDGKHYMDVEMTEITAVDRHDDSIFRKPE
jgi:hypothetical protein